jgi:carbamoylphosphate synthase small subunit
LGWDTIELDERQEIPDLEPYDLMLVMGGPQDVWEEDQYPWMRTEKAAIRTFVMDMRRPYLGVWLGHQLLANAIGSDRMSSAHLRGSSPRVFQDLKSRRRDPCARDDFRGFAIRASPINDFNGPPI